MAYETSAEAEHHAPHVNSFVIFLALCVCTLISVVFDIVPMNRRLVAVLVLAVAVAKAQFVMRYFMHLKFEGRWKYVLLLPTAILACGLPLALAPDIAMHYYSKDPELSLRVADLEHDGTHAPDGEPAHDGDHDGAAHAGPGGATE
jgi:cytochrome c oxidase subunit IV